jgi:hypothetical protein
VKIKPKAGVTRDDCILLCVLHGGGC